MKKKVIVNIESVYTANAFSIGAKTFVGAGSETKPEVFLYDISTEKSSFVSGCPGGVMSFVPVPGKLNVFFSVMGLFPPFIGAEAGIFMHEKTNEGWKTTKALDLPFAHRCEIISEGGNNYLFAASVSKHKENPADWSKPGEIHVCCIDEEIQLPLQTEIIDEAIIRNHGLLKITKHGKEILYFSGAEGIFYFELENKKWIKKQLFDREVSEFALVDLDGDGQNELVTIEPFHGQALKVYKQSGKNWELMCNDSLSFGHGLSAGIFKGEPVIVVGNRADSLTLDMFKVNNLQAGNFSRQVMEENAGPTQTQVFSANGIDYILSSNQKKNEVALYY